MSAADELAQALRQLAIGEDDFHLADLLIETAQRVEQHGQARLREQVQGVLGESHVTIQDRLDALLNIGRDTHQLTMAVQSEQIRQGGAITEQGAAVLELRATFQEVAETVDHLAERDAQQYQESQQIHAELYARQDRAAAEVDLLSARVDEAHDRLIVLEARLAARPSPEKAQATYDGVQQMQRDFARLLDHLGVTLDESDHAAER